MDLEKTLLLFDWDDVLFNAAEFKNYFTDALEELAMSRVTIYETYQAAKQLGSGGYTFAGHLSLLSNAYPQFRDQIKAIFDTTIKRSPAFVFPDAKQMVITAGLKGNQIGVLSAGDEQFQMEKIQRSGLLPQFNFVKIIPLGAEHKAAEIEKLLPQYERVVFFEDRIDMLEAAAALTPDRQRLALVYVNRDGSLHQLPQGTVQTASLDSAIISKLCFE